MNSGPSPNHEIANNTAQAKSGTEKSPGWQFLLASSLVGLTAGLFAGMSESPVATALIGGVFGLIGGGGIFGLLARDGDKQTTAESETISPHLVRNLRPAAVATSLLCLFCIIGVFFGIGFREGFLISQPKKSDTEELIAIAEAAKDFERPLQLKLIILQSELDTLGIPPTQNNQFVRSCIVAIRETDPKSLGENSLQNMKRDARDTIETIGHALFVISQEPENPDEEDDRKLRLKPYEELSYGKVKEAFEYLKAASNSAHGTENHILRSTAPDLSLVLDLISKYRKSNLYQPAGRHAGALVNPKRYRDSKPENELFIKP